MVKKIVAIIILGIALFNKGVIAQNSYNKDSVMQTLPKMNNDLQFLHDHLYNIDLVYFKVDDRPLNLDSVKKVWPIIFNRLPLKVSICTKTKYYTRTNPSNIFIRFNLEGQPWRLLTDTNYFDLTITETGKYYLSVNQKQSYYTNSLQYLVFSISKPFWSSYWFYSALLTFLVLLVYGWQQLKLKKMIALEELRAKVARDLHDDMGSTLSTINILSTMAKNKLHTDVAATEMYLEKIMTNSQNMMEAIDDIVWAIKPDQDAFPKTIARIREFAASVCEAKNIELHMQVQEEINPILLNMEQRRHVYLICKEAINNAVKYSACTWLTITVNKQVKQIVITITDNGIGFNVKQADSGNGLSNMQKRAASLKAFFDITSNEKTGTTIQLKIPITV